MTMSAINTNIQVALADNGVGEEIYRLVQTLFPICRSITGDGVRETLSHVRNYIPLELIEVPTGTSVFDWTIPQEWNIRDAYIKNIDGERIVDFRKSNLHVVGYSEPVRARMSLAELKKHLITLPDQPDLVPYRTSYYNKTWGFCLSHNQLKSLADDSYEVCIDSELKDGHLTYGEFVLEGRTTEEILISTHICHPSLANDNLSGIGLSTFLARNLQKSERRYTYRFVFLPGTIGSITWLSRNEAAAARIKNGLVISCVGDRGGPTYKRSRKGNAEIDRVVEHVLKLLGMQAVIEDFSPYGYDERQYCSPGFNLSVGLFERSKYGTFPEYHNSADNLEFVRPECLQESYDVIARVIAALENNHTYLNRNPMCEPQLGKRGLYATIGGDKDAARKQMAMLWILNMADGSQSLLDIAERANIPFNVIAETASVLEDGGLLNKVS